MLKSLLTRRRLVLLAIGLIGIAAGAAVGRWVYRKWLAERELARIVAAGEPATPADLAEISRVPNGVPDATAAWRKPMARLQRREVGNYPIGLTILDSHGMLEPPGEPWSEYQAAKEFVGKQAALYAEIDAAIDAPGESAFVNDYSGGYQTLLAHAQHLRMLTRLLILRAYVQQQEGDAQGVANSLAGVFRATEILLREPFLVSQQIRMVHNHAGLEALENLLPSVRFSDAELAELQGTLLAVDYHPGLIGAVMGERVQGLVAFSNPATAGADDVVPGSLYQIWIGDDPYHHLMVMGELVAAAKKDWPEILQATEKLAALSADRADVRGPLGRGQWEVPSAIVGATRRLFERGAIETARTRGAATGLAATRFHLAEGRWPRSLEELVPKWIDAVPVDPCTGELLRFAVDAAGFRVYSVGIDGRDDGGVETPVTEQGDTSRKGTPDVVFTVRVRGAGAEEGPAR